MDSLLTSAAQLGGTVFVTVAFLWYLNKRDREFGESLTQFNSTLADHVKVDVEIQRKIATNLERLNSKIDGLTKKKQ